MKAEIDSLAASVGARYEWVVEHRPDRYGIQAPYAWEARVHFPTCIVRLTGRTETLEGSDNVALLTIKEALVSYAYETRQRNRREAERAARETKRFLR